MESKITNPLSSDYNENTDNQLITEVLNGSTKSLEALIKRHQDYIYNLAQKMVLSPFDAEDITQEVLIKIITKLSQFNGKSSFRTWLYRITINHILKMKKQWLESEITSFDNYGSQLDSITNATLTPQEEEEMKDLIIESKLACMNGMLLCLDREQRIVYVLGEVFQIGHKLGAELLGMSKDNFRQKLSRARNDLRHFMGQKCGLINENNPCRCSKKTKGFINAGWVDPSKMKFNTAYLKQIKEIIPNKSKELDDIIETRYDSLFYEDPFQEKDHITRLMKGILKDNKIKGIFNI